MAEETKVEKKNKGLGCVSLIIICLIVGYFLDDKTGSNAPDKSDKYFNFDDSKFMNIYKSKANGKITLKRRADTDRGQEIYALNNHSLLVIHKNPDNNKVRSACVVYENDEKYRDDDSVILEASQDLLLSFVDLGYLGADHWGRYLTYLQDNVFSKPVQERRNLKIQQWKFTKVVDKKTVPYFNIVSNPSGNTGSYCVEKPW